ncbi:hypothetical protein NDU88_001248 [Pleurodeles waltl]|uniref:Uncharacterized protein n=1 Tax=Pleurodeles waltl TaxID=8319 RepID=A0AAV7P7D1_PLEWA|nr:hypothetical protein NDU88_001248 [Pleurodeles waltl]
MALRRSLSVQEAAAASRELSRTRAATGTGRTGEQRAPLSARVCRLHSQEDHGVKTGLRSHQGQQGIHCWEAGRRRQRRADHFRPPPDLIRALCCSHVASVLAVRADPLTLNVHGKTTRPLPQTRVPSTRGKDVQL